ncbi:MAG: dihydroorotate dehydrogenase electron transfer subunit [Salinarimonas sp.]|nr:dihydroorotate dehydrogenase electron transfer subunit [Salinarimonas sp.]
MQTVHAVPPQPDSLPVLEERAEILRHEAVNGEYRLMQVAAPAQAKLARAGQFFHLLCPQDDALKPFFRRPMSIYAIDAEGGRISFLYKVTGTGTKALAKLAIGERLDMLGPLGIGFSLPRGKAPIVILARGVGLATLAPLVGLAQSEGHAVTAILSARSPDLLMSVEETRAAGADAITVTDAQGNSDTGHVASLLDDLHQQGRMGALYACGSNRLLKLAQEHATRHGLFGEVAMEQQMACGLGMCFCCVRAFREGDATVHRRVCCEGPVFPLEEALGW